MESSVTLQKRIINFLLTSVRLNDTESQRAFIVDSALERDLEAQIQFGQSAIHFISLLVSALNNYGKLSDGRYALEAVLETAKNYVGCDKKIECEKLLKELYAINLSYKTNNFSTCTNKNSSAMLRTSTPIPHIQTIGDIRDSF